MKMIDDFIVKPLEWVAKVLVVIGSLNYGLAIFGINLVEMLPFKPWTSNAIYLIIGISGLFVLGAWLKRGLKAARLLR